MDLLLAVVALVIITLFIVAALALYFSDELREYLAAKTKELRALTELIKKEKENA